MSNHVFTHNPQNTTGARMINGTESNRIIDFSISNKWDLIENEYYDKKAKYQITTLL